MPELTAEQFAQRAVDYRLIDPREMETVFSELGSRELPRPDLCTALVRKELLTNFQTDRILAGKRTGYYYGQYKVLYMVGSGTFARVYRAVDASGKVFAVKVLRQRYSDDGEKTDQFIREAEMVKKLRHPNIVPIYEVISKGQEHFMVMAFVEGQNLRDFLKARRRFSVEESLTVIADVAAGLDYALSKGITHRDLKLSNVLISSTGRASLVDFGLAAAELSLKDKSLDNVSNPRSIDYAGLERITGVRRDHKQSDLFFAGCMLYQLLCGEPPLAETRDRLKRLAASRFQNIKPITDWIPDLPLSVLQIVQKSMELSPDKRYATPASMKKDIDAVLELSRQGNLRQIESEMQGQPVLPTQRQRVLEGEDRTVMIVEGNADLQSAFRQQLKKFGYRVLLTTDPQRALRRFRDEDGLAHCAVFSAGQIGARALEAFNDFGSDMATAAIPAILLVDASQREFAEQAKLARHRVIMTMPIKFKEFRAMLHELIAGGKGA